MRANAGRASALLVATVAIAALAAGCAPSPDPSPAPTPTPSASVSASPSASPEPAPTFAPEGTAEENLPIVEAALQPLVAAGGIPAGRSVVDALTGAGIPASALQVTADQTAIGLPVDSLLLSVRSGEECVLAQFDGDGFATATAPVLSSGACLVGATASID